mgnify:CR=1 FL=1
METVRARSNVKLVSGESEKGKRRLRKLISRPTYKSSRIFEDLSLVSVNTAKAEVTLDEPIAVGQAILDISKTIMFDFHYGYSKPKWGNKVKVLASNTDSLFYHVETDDVYKDVSGDVERWFDTSNYSPDHSSGIPTGRNKKVLTLF